MPGRSDIVVRVVRVVLALAVGLLVGTLGSFKYRYGLAATVQLPIGLVVVLLMIALVLAAVRAVAGRRYGIAAAVGVLGAIALFAMKGPGGSVVVPEDRYGTVWAVAPAVIAVVVLGVPVPRRRRARRRPVRRADGILDAPPKGSSPP